MYHIPRFGYSQGLALCAVRPLIADCRCQTARSRSGSAIVFPAELQMHCLLGYLSSVLCSRRTPRFAHHRRPCWMSVNSDICGPSAYQVLAAVSGALFFFAAEVV